jgi:hypothetical protein
MNDRVIEINGKLYIVKRTISEAQVKGDTEALKIWTQMLGCDRSFKNNGVYYLVNDITDIDYEQITNTV